MHRIRFTSKDAAASYHAVKQPSRIKLHLWCICVARKTQYTATSQIEMHRPSHLDGFLSAFALGVGFGPELALAAALASLACAAWRLKTVRTSFKTDWAAFTPLCTSLTYMQDQQDENRQRPTRNPSGDSFCHSCWNPASPTVSGKLFSLCSGVALITEVAPHEHKAFRQHTRWNAHVYTVYLSLICIDDLKLFTYSR